MIADFAMLAQWGQSIPIAAPQWIDLLWSAPSLLSPTQRTRWTNLMPRLDSSLTTLGKVHLTEPRGGSKQQAYENNLALCLLNFAFPATPAGDDLAIQCAIGIQNFTPANLKELYDIKTDSEDLRAAIAANTSFGRTPQGV